MMSSSIYVVGKVGAFPLLMDRVAKFVWLVLRRSRVTSYLIELNVSHLVS